MAINNTISAVASRGHHRYTLTVTEDRTENNSSFLSFVFQIAQASSSSYYRWLSSDVRYTLTIGDNTYTGNITDYYSTAPMNIRTGTNIEIKHESDGQKAIDISFNVTDYTQSQYTSGNASASATIELSALHKTPTINEVILKELVQDISDNNFVTNMSQKQFSIDAESYDDTTIVKYEVYSALADKKIWNYESDTNKVTVTFDTVYVSNIDDKTIIPIIIRVTDSFGAYSEKYIEYEGIVTPYLKPTLNTSLSSIKRNGQTSGKVMATLFGAFYYGYVENIKNELTILYKYWRKGEQEPNDSEYYPIEELTFDDNFFGKRDIPLKNNGEEITDVEEEYVYNFKIKIIDTFNNYEENILICASGEYLMCKFKDRVDFKKITIKRVNPFEYSTEERVVGTWIDGKPLYEKTGSVTITEKGVWAAGDMISEEIDVGSVIQVYQHLIPAVGLYNTYNHPVTSNIYVENGEDNADKGRIRAFTDRDDFLNVPIYAVVRYTKTTDIL